MKVKASITHYDRDFVEFLLETPQYKCKGRLSKMTYSVWKAEHRLEYELKRILLGFLDKDIEIDPLDIWEDD